MEAVKIPSYWQENVDGRTLVGMRCGGTVRFLAKPRTREELEVSLGLVTQLQLPYKILGGGSNLILADAGFNGVVIQPCMNDVVRYAEVPADLAAAYAVWSTHSAPAGRYQAERMEGFLHLDDPAVDLSKDAPTTLYEVGAGGVWAQVVMQSLQAGLCGLQWYARIPCRVGGAVYNNIHGQHHLLAESVCAVRALDPQTLTIHTYSQAELEFDYDYSRFHRTGEVIISVVFALADAGVERVVPYKELYLQWTREKTQIQPSGANSGSVFQNIPKEVAERAGQTAIAAAWYIDQCGYKGHQEGGMSVFSGHANFIINTGGGTQQDFITLVEKIRDTVYKRFGVRLQPEVECIDELGRKHEWEVIQ